MKSNPTDRRPATGPEGHLIRELIGLASMNVSKYSVAHIVAPAGSRGVMRENQFDEIMIIIAGQGTLRRAYDSESVGPKDVLLLPAGTRYALDADQEEDVEFWALCVPAFRPEWSSTGSAKRNWRDYQTPRGADRLREMRKHDEE